jgi:hypothetical protein
LVFGGRKSDTINLRSILGTIDELYTPAGHQQVGRRREMVSRIMPRICARYDSAKFGAILGSVVIISATPGSRCALYRNEQLVGFKFVAVRAEWTILALKYIVIGWGEGLDSHMDNSARARFEATYIERSD